MSPYRIIVPLLQLSNTSSGAPYLNNVHIGAGKSILQLILQAYITLNHHLATENADSMTN
jgi:hypothetical protein